MRKIIASQDEIETGARKVREGSRWQQSTTRRNLGFSIRQGVRRRHPNKVLNQYATVAKETKNANSVWEKALMDENERATLDKEYEWHGDGRLMANQMGVVKLALDNYEKSKYKLERAHIVGV